MTISLCMIVKNEEAVLDRCLGSIADLMDEIVIVDTGSTDRTKEIASKYTDRIYDFEWIGDFSAARNFAFSKATMDYIYSADADEVVDAVNHERFRLLKEKLLPEIDLVQMKYGNQLQYSTVYNFDEEYRPKLFKRLRPFVWEEPVHEQVRLNPVIYDSDVVITHMPQGSHAGRDLKIFREKTAGGEQLSRRLFDMYVRELFLAGDEEDFRGAKKYFLAAAADTSRSSDEVREACLVVAHAAELAGDTVTFFKYIVKLMADDPSSETCIELGRFYEKQKDYEEAAIWYYNAAFETTPIVRMASANADAAGGLKRVYEAMGMPEAADSFLQDIANRMNLTAGLS
ncbi:MAG: glycosyltransferase family 2 protein [Lachnospiraceae bacterium]|nr:glycosyltransferase family 2 protein [Lachnospiraceae bacterium]